MLSLKQILMEHDIENEAPTQILKLSHGKFWTYKFLLLSHMYAVSRYSINADMF